MKKEIEIPEGYEARIKGDKIIIDLKDNEDERIRKGLISHLHELKEKSVEGSILKRPEHYDAWISYLEKQKEQPKEELVYRLNGLMQEYINGGKDEEEREHRFKCYQLFWDALEDANFFEQKEQKPNNMCCFEIGDEITDGNSTFKIVDIQGEYYIADDGDKVCFYVAHRYYTPTKEKKEKKPAEWSEKEKERIRQNGRLDVCYNPEKYGLCHKTEWSEEDKHNIEEVISILNESGGYLNDNNDLLMDWLKSLPERFSIQKQEWSEEDKGRVLQIITALESEGARYLNIDGKVRYKKLVSWLKSSLERFNPQPKQGWSEEDDFMATTVENSFYLHCGQMTDRLSEQYKKFFKKVKSLRPQQNQPNKSEFGHLVCELVTDIVANEHLPENEKKPTRYFVEKYTVKFMSSQPYWKPSEEQINAIDLAIRFVTDDFDEHPTLSETLRGLYYELKKL